MKIDHHCIASPPAYKILNFTLTILERKLPVLVRKINSMLKLSLNSWSNASLSYICSMKIKGIFFLLILLSGLTSCVEIIDDLTLNTDGSGTFKYTLNLSSSKVKINSYLALDSLDGKKVPSISEISDKANIIVEELKKKEGITGVSFEADYTEFIFKIKLEFTSLHKLQNAIKEVIRSESKEKNLTGLDYDWVKYSDNILNRSVPQITINKAKEINSKDAEQLKTGSYTSITRFEKEIEKFDNDKAVLSKNRKAVMLRTDPYSLSQNPHLLDNVIYLVK